MVDSRDEVEIDSPFERKRKMVPGRHPGRASRCQRELGRDQVEAQPTVDFTRLDAVLVPVTPPGEGDDPRALGQPEGEVMRNPCVSSPDSAHRCTESRFTSLLHHLFSWTSHFTRHPCPPHHELHAAARAPPSSACEYSVVRGALIVFALGYLTDLIGIAGRALTFTYVAMFLLARRGRALGRADHAHAGRARHRFPRCFTQSRSRFSGHLRSRSVRSARALSHSCSVLATARRAARVSCGAAHPHGNGSTWRGERHVTFVTRQDAASSAAASVARVRRRDRVSLSRAGCFSSRS